MKFPGSPKPEKSKKSPAATELIDGVREELQRVAAADGPIVAGPFTGEVGFELLYWIPMLRWALQEVPSLRGRLVVVSRGGVESWLDGMDCRYVDIFSLVTPEELVAGRPSLKQRETTAFESQIVRKVGNAIGAPVGGLLHPSLLFNLYYKVAKADPYAFAKAVTRTDVGATGLAASFTPLQAPARAALADRLPDDYVAVRFYFRPSFDDTPENRQFATRAIERIARQRPVVLLNNGLELDDHYDLSEIAGPNIITIHDLMTPATNLHVQTVATAHASAFVGTYGGLAYLSPLFGVPSLSFSSKPEETQPWHLDLAARLFDGQQFGTIASLRPSEVDLVGLVAGAAG